MGFLGVIFTLLTAFQLADPQLSPGWSRAIDAGIWTLWGAFVIDFVAKLVAAPMRGPRAVSSWCC